MTIIIYATAFTVWLAVVGLVLTFVSATPCTCPIPFSRWMVGERCPRHEETTEAAMPLKEESR